ncbi:MAG: protein-export chaperone SecB [Ectothiorhodospiraceae bacterium]|nr:protein-export chaperone SecB [Chromatiales bacterium]MCP5155025.1 protein-export chaperone SecB [Ectothiorhodospiraceae bacterium]
MTDENPAAGAGRPSGAEFTIKKIYVKDVSFESPTSPEIFTVPWQPELDLQMHTGASRFGPADYEVTLNATATVKVGERTAFLAEVQIGGVFGITGVPESDLAPLLGTYCPTILFPYLREVVSDLAVRGGFPQMLLQPVNFDALYQQHLAQEGGAGGETH